MSSDFDSNYISYMWRRSQGLDVNVYLGDGNSGRRVHHQLNAVPEMVWIKSKDDNSTDWIVYHKGLNGGSNPHTHYIVLNSSAEEVDSTNAWNDTAPTSTAIYVGGWANVNADNKNYLCVAFRSDSGISAVGSYTGNGSSTGPTITVGFEPRFIMLKNADSGGNGWAVLDTLRGLGTSSQKRLWLDWDEQQDGTAYNFVTTTSTTFQPTLNNSEINEDGATILYYAHA